MKKIIVFIAILPILFYFPMQHVVDTVNHYKITAFQNITFKAIQIARIEGRFTEENINEMKDSLKKAFYINDSEISVTATTDPVYRLEHFSEDHLISYKIGIPIKKLIAMHKFWKISDEDNQGMYYIEGKVQSELLKPIY